MEQKLFQMIRGIAISKDMIFNTNKCSMFLI